MATPILPVPPDYSAGSTGKWLFTIWAGIFAFVTLPYCIYRLRKHGDAVALYAWTGGWIVWLGEPMLDTMGHLWWPTNLPGPALEAWDLSVPFLIPPCYVFFISMTGYFAYRMFLKGVTVKGVFLVWLAVAATDLALEIPGTASDVYRYYGDQPFAVFDFPMHWAWTNGTTMVAVGFVLYLLAPHLRGPKRGLLVLAPVLGFLGAYGVVAWPAFLSINIEVSSAAMHVIDLGSLALCLLLLRGMAAVVATDAPQIRIGNVTVGGGAPPPEPAGNGRSVVDRELQPVELGAGGA